jgi:CheY-like chemotaxis protein
MEKSQTSARPVVLLVDPDLVLRSQIAGFFSDCGFRVMTAQDGLEALRMITDAPEIGLVFSRITLAGSMDGFTLALQARAARPGLKVALVTNEAMAFHKARLLRDEHLSARG